MPTNTLPIVGSHYGPQRGSPSKTLIAALPIGTPLQLIAEPDNAYDPNAIAVYVNSAHIPLAAHATLEVDLADYGFTLDQIITQELWHLGYIARDFAYQLAENGFMAEGPVDVTFSLSANGAPRVRSETPFPTA